MSDPGGARFPQHRYARDLGRDLLEQLKPFPRQAVIELVKTGGVAARPRQAVDEAGADRVDALSEHERHGAARLLQRRNGLAWTSQDDVRAEREQFHRLTTQARDIACAPAGINPHVAANGPSVFLHPLQKRREAGLCFRFVCCHCHEHADAPHALGLLCPAASGHVAPRRREE